MQRPLKSENLSELMDTLAGHHEDRLKEVIKNILSQPNGLNKTDNHSLTGA